MWWTDEQTNRRTTLSLESLLWLKSKLRILFIIKTEVPDSGIELFNRYFTQSTSSHKQYQLSDAMIGENQDRVKYRLVHAGKKYAKLLSLLIDPAGVVGFRVDDGEAFALEILSYLHRWISNSVKITFL